jgi:hypothetical protein
MKNHIRDMMLLTFLLLTSSMMWAKGQVSIIQTGQGNASYSFRGNSICDLEMLPASGFYITAEHIKVVKTIDGGSAKSPKRAPDVAEPVELLTGNPDANPFGYTWYYFVMEGDYDYEVTVDFRDPHADKLLIVGYQVITDKNRTDILGDGGSMKYDGNNMLVFQDLAYEQYGGIQSWNDNLVIYLKGTNTMTAKDANAIEGHGGTLTFTTEGNTPGTLKMKTTVNGPVIKGYDFTVFMQNLAMLSGSIAEQEIEIATPVTPIVDEAGETNTVDVGGEDAGDQDLSNTVINNVLYTLDEDNDDGVDPDENCVVLGSTMVEDDVRDIIANYEPGTPEFAEKFAGLTFMVPAGYGKILITAKTGEDGVLNVQVGMQEPFVITGALEFQTFEFPYACSEATYVYVYSNSPVVDTEESAAANNRAVKKTTVTVGLSSVGVNASGMQSSNSEGDVDGDEVTVTDEGVEYDAEEGTLVVNNPDVNTLTDDMFVGFPFLKYVDLRNTSITGVNVSRESGPFAGLSKNTFIYMPVGNTTNEANVIIGNICQSVVLDADMSENESFGLSGSFVSGCIELDRIFKKDETTTLCLPFDICAEDMEYFGHLYHVKSVDQGYVKVEEVTDGLKAHVPYLFKAADNNTQLYTLDVVEMSMPAEPSASRAADATGWLVGCYDNTYSDGADGAFRLVPNNDLEKLKFVRMQNNERIIPFQAYLKTDCQDDELGVTDKVVTGVVDIRRELSEVRREMYDLQGRKVKGRLNKGIYIINGQKTVIR